MDIWLQVHRENAARRLQQGPGVTGCFWSVGG